MDITNCPECGSVAEVLWRTEVESTDGLVEHAKVLCLNRHGFLLPTAALRAPSEPAHRFQDRPDVEPRPDDRRQTDDHRHEREQVPGAALEGEREGRKAACRGHRTQESTGKEEAAAKDR